MKPYYEEAGITIYHGDCMEVLPEIHGVKCCVTSPPYNQSISAFGESGMHKETSWVAKISSGYRDEMPEDEYQQWQVDVFSLVAACLDDDGSLFYNHKIRWRDGILSHPVVWTAKFPMRLRQEIIWARNGSVTLNARMFAPNDERILWFVRGKHKWNQDSVSHFSVWRVDQYGSFGSARTGIAGHPCAYPIELPKRCIMASTDEGDTILDPFAGSGTTLVAAKDLGRKAIGIELEEKYCEIAANRLRQSVFNFEETPCVT